LPQLRRRALLEHKTQKQESGLGGGGKVEIQKQDFHFPTAPTACGSKEEELSTKTKIGPSPTALERGHFY